MQKKENQERNCCICLCVYNNERGLPYVLNNANNLTNIGLFDKIKILVFYDHSSDNSLQILNIYNSKYNNMELFINPEKVSGSDVVNIAYARNGLLQMIRDKYSQFEYFMMMDSNEYSCIGQIKLDVLKEMIERSDWDSVSFDREAGYYDYWALSYDPFIYSFHHFYSSDLDYLYQIMSKDFLKKIEDFKLSNPDELFPVYSAFNGCALYRSAKFLNCNYSSDIDINLFPSEIIDKNQELFGSNRSNRFTDDCEHRHFHMEAIFNNDAKIRICTKSIFKKVANPPPGLRGNC